MIRRHIFRISLVMLLGVVTSVAVAWGCAWRVQDNQLDYAASTNAGNYATAPAPIIGQRQETIIEDAGESFGLIESRYFGYMILEDFMWDDTLPGWEQVPIRTRADVPWWSSSIAGSQDYVSRYQFAAGWPFAACRSYGHWYFQEGNQISLAVKLRRTNGTIVLPYGPIWPGLLANTAIYGSAWWALLFGPGMFIRWRRRRAGRCVKCGYDLRGLSPGSECPECGRAPA